MASDLVDTGFPQFAISECLAGNNSRPEWIVRTTVSELVGVCNRSDYCGSAAVAWPRRAAICVCTS